jgi:hypothetical protein
MCFVVLLGAAVPRLTLVALWLFSEWTSVLAPWWLALLGFLFLPYTTLAYVAIHRYSGDVSTASMAHLVIMLVALLTDVGAWGGGHRHYKSRG